MFRIPAPVHVALIVGAVGVASLRYHVAGGSALPAAVSNARSLVDPAREPDEVTLADRRWAEVAARERFGRGPVGYVGEYPTAYEAEWWYYVACYSLAPTIVVPRRAADRVVLDRPPGLTVVAGERR